MKKFIRYILPHIALVMLVGIMLITVLDGYNPFMGFLTSAVSKRFIFIGCIAGVISAVALIIRNNRSE